MLFKIIDNERSGLIDALYQVLIFLVSTHAHFGMEKCRAHAGDASHDIGHAYCFINRKCMG